MKRDNIAAILGSCLASERAVLGVIDWLGPVDALALGIALAIPTGAARQTAERLVGLGLLVLEWPGNRQPPAYALSAAALSGDQT